MLSSKRWLGEQRHKYELDKDDPSRDIRKTLMLKIMRFFNCKRGQNIDLSEEKIQLMVHWEIWYRCNVVLKLTEKDRFKAFAAAADDDDNGEDGDTKVKDIPAADWYYFYIFA